MAQDRPKKFKVGDLKGKDELLKRVPYGKKSELQKEEAGPVVPPKEEVKPPLPENKQDQEEKTAGAPKEPAGVFESDGVKRKEVEKLEADWRSRMKSREEKEEVEEVKAADSEDEKLKGRSNVRSYLFAVLLLVSLSIIGATAGYLYSNPNKLKDVAGRLFPSKIEKTELISPVPIPTSSEGSIESSKAKIGYTTESGSLFFEGKVIYEVENKWYGPQGEVHVLPGGKRLAYLALDKASAQQLSELDKATEGPTVGYLNILNLGNGMAKSFDDEKMFINSGIAVSPNGNKVAYVSEPYGLRQIDLDSSEIEDLDESIDLKVVGGSLRYSSDGKHLYYSLAVSGGEGESYSLEIWRINLETKAREPIVEVESTFDPKVYNAPAGIDFDVKGNLLTFIKNGDLVVYDLEKDSEKFKTVGSRGFAKVTFVDSKVAAVDSTVDDFSVSIFNVNTGKERRLQSLQIAEIENLLNLDKEKIASKAVLNIVPMDEERLVLELVVFIRGEENPRYYIVGSDINLESFNLFGEGSHPFVVR